MMRLTIKEYIDKQGITRYELSRRTGLIYQIIDRYYKNAVVRYDSYVLDKICEALDCQISDIIEYKK
jgi:putative transcriptional regulator